MTGSHSSFENPKLSDTSKDGEITEIKGQDKDEEIQEEEEEQVNIYSSPEDLQELWRVRGQLKPEPKPSSAYTVRLFLIN